MKEYAKPEQPDKKGILKFSGYSEENKEENNTCSRKYFFGKLDAEVRLKWLQNHVKKVDVYLAGLEVNFDYF